MKPRRSKPRITPEAQPKTKRPRIAAGVRTKAQRMIAAGISNLEISGRLGISEGSVRYIRSKMVRPEVAAPSPVETAPCAAPDAPSVPTAPDATAVADGLDLGGDLKALVRSLIGKALAVAKVAEEDRNTTAAAKALRDAIGALPGLIRLEKADAENVDAVAIPREKIDAEIEAIYGRARTLASVEMCPRCGRELRMAAVGAERKT